MSISDCARGYAGETLCSIRGKKKEKGRSVNGIVLDRHTFFLRPGPSSFLHLTPGSALPRRLERGLSGTTSTTTPNKRPQKNSSNLSLPVAYYQSPRQSQIGLVGPVCASWTPGRTFSSSLLVHLVFFCGSQLPRFETTHIHTAQTRVYVIYIRIYVWGTRVAFASEIEYSQVDERRSHVSPCRETGESLQGSTTLGEFFFSQRADSLRKFLSKDVHVDSDCKFVVAKPETPSGEGRS